MPVCGAMTVAVGCTADFPDTFWESFVIVILTTSELTLTIPTLVTRTCRTAKYWTRICWALTAGARKTY